VEFRRSTDKINLNEKWTDDITKKDKLIACVKTLLKRNMNAVESFNFNTEIVQNINE